jgi:bifunctional non-homologous end joining protein LigD
VRAYAVSDRIPFRARPMLATLVPKPFDQPGWVYEEKYDGIRILAYKEAKRVTLLTRNERDRTDKF